MNSQITSLENQVLGSYKEIDDDLVLVSSVRGPSSSKATVLPADRKRAVDAKLNQDFNRDDLDELKDMAILGETLDGRVALLPPQLRKIQASAKDLTLAQTLIEEENRDRLEIWQRIISGNSNLSTKDLPDVRRTYAKIQKENASPGHYVQDASGAWIKHPGA